MAALGGRSSTQVTHGVCAGLYEGQCLVSGWMGTDAFAEKIAVL